MSAGVALTDADRWDWLVSLREAAVDTLDSRSVPGVVLTCSALKRKYRDVIRVACYNDQAVKVHFIYLSASEQLLMDRIQSRRNHFMKPAMVKSQLQSLEVPTQKEKDVVSIDVSGSMETVNRAVVDVVAKVLVEDLEGSLS
jgi:carbohydrate kinase (thermoresistant glucokinase family)